MGCSITSAPVGAIVKWRCSLIALVIACSVSIQLQSSAWAAESRWFVILGSMPQTATGLRQANSLAEQVARAYSMDNLIVSETAFYPGLTPGLYVVMLGPYLNSANAQQAMRDSGVRGLVSDAYVKEAQMRDL